MSNGTQLRGDKSAPQKQRPERECAERLERPRFNMRGIVGAAAAIALAEALGGTRIYVPARMKGSHRLARIAGIEAARALSEACKGCCIRVPLERDLRAAHYRALGLSHARIAHRLGLTENGVQSLLKRLQAQKSEGR